MEYCEHDMVRGWCAVCKIGTEVYDDEEKKDDDEFLANLRKMEK